jgi:hypothetical protein
MKQHYWETPTDYRATVSRGFQLLRPQAFNVPNQEAVRDFKVPVVPAQGRYFCYRTHCKGSQEAIGSKNQNYAQA